MATSDESNSSSALIPNPDTKSEPAFDVKDERSTEDQSPAGSNVQQGKTKTGGLWFFTIINFIVLVAIIAGGVWYYLNIWHANNQQQADAIAQVSQQQSIVDNLSAAQSGLNQKITEASNQNANDRAAVEQALADSEAKISALEKQLAESQLRLSEIGGRRPADWLLAEADYLVRMAGRKLWLENDDRSALMLLTAADARLADLNDSSLLPIRALLAEDIQTLQQLNPVSLTSVALSLSGMIPQVDNLPIATLKLPDLAEGEAILPLTDSVSDWRENLRRTWRALVNDFISVKNREMPVEPLMSEQAQWLVREQLSFTLLQAKTAAIQGESTLYQQALQRALGLIVENYELTAVEVEQFSAALQNLQQINIERNFPPQLRVQQPLTDRLNERINRLFSNEGSAL